MQHISVIGNSVLSANVLFFYRYNNDPNEFFFGTLSRCVSFSHRPTFAPIQNTLLPHPHLRRFVHFCFCFSFYFHCRRFNFALFNKKKRREQLLLKIFVLLLSLIMLYALLPKMFYGREQESRSLSSFKHLLHSMGKK